jgi:hypothetical protein
MRISNYLAKCKAYTDYLEKARAGEIRLPMYTKASQPEQAYNVHTGGGLIFSSIE